ncbi:DEAD/DEAH box helicase [Inquilinus limosus]|uniref:DEAD/DEAH box helicase n=1 Tax=Inquilinus limosus TaxID=171674 RepID=A0A211ZED2_9PROT|nr:DEAD/DEAH box helicase [Inquilinus limosus]OWJ63611.1 hypothetical protein BWR60_28645 [Inquilinus limosus]
MIDFERMMSRLPEQAADAILGMLKPRSRTLAKHLRDTWGASAGAPGSLLAEPLVEGAFPWLPLADGWEGLPGHVLDPRTIEALRAVSFPPYAHQAAAWEALTAHEPASVIVSSGTGSGKTECFLVPILDRLVRLSDGGRHPLEGVRALMLYPLNALISSQEERLSRWFAPFGGALRYALYNGETPETASAETRRATPWRVGDRTALRASPTPVLVTNATMLEYMLIRQNDAPILSASQGTLDFVVLDEAHSYMGAQAAEIALLLRRVALAFGREPKDLRYIATSATIGGPNARDELARFLGDLSGAPVERIRVVEGERAPLPPAPVLDERLVALDALSEMDAAESGARLAASPGLRNARETLRSGGVFSWQQWSQIAQTTVEADARPTRLLVEAARARDPNATEAMVASGNDSILPTRVHLFHRTLAGVWACINPNCSGRPGGDARSDWAYGAVFFESRGNCPHCKSIVLEWAVCTLCGDGALRAEEVDGGSRITSWSDTAEIDDFEQTLEREVTDDEEGVEDSHSSPTPPVAPTRVSRRYLHLPLSAGLRHLVVERETGILDGEDESIVFGASADLSACCGCGDAPASFDPARGALRPANAGAPFLMAQITPGFLADLSPEPHGDQPLPCNGRRLITFTDARQGTARHAANIQIASERGFVRGFLYHFVQERNAHDPAEIAKLDQQIAAMRGLSSDTTYAAILKELEGRRAALVGTTARPWSELVSHLSRHTTVNTFLRTLWTTTNRDPRFEDPTILAEFLLYREAMRRPVRANSAETLGLFRYELPGIDDANVLIPASAHAVGLSEGDWRDLLRLIVTHFVRTNVALHFDRWWLNWIDRRQSHIEIIPWAPGQRSSRYIRLWPNPYGLRLTRIVRLVFQALMLDPEVSGDRDKVGALFDDAWTALKRYMATTDNGFRMRLGALSVARVESAFWCPTTRRVLDTTLKGLSPYDVDGVHPVAEPIVMPLLPFVWRRDESGYTVPEASLDAWMGEDERVVRLREAGRWTDQNDRAAKLSPWLRAAEHSAQQPSSVLRRYERQFKEGRINVLGCSTTMEMGVDIGSIEGVLNTNTPPEIANYRQRVGRAGRARQPIAVGLTLCKDKPLDRMTIANPLAYLGRQARTPRVSLESPTIATRHAAALLLARFLADSGTELHKLANGAFFGLVDASATYSDPTPVASFLSWLDRTPNDAALGDELHSLLSGTPILPGLDLVENLRSRMERITSEIRAEWEALASTGQDVGVGDVELAAANRAREIQRSRLERGFLLGELAGRGFLPSYGFPTDVVQFITETAGEKSARQHAAAAGDAELSEKSFGRGYPSRSREVGIYEYAPGRGIVVDGVVRESAGVTLNWQRPASQAGLREIQSLRTMWSCQSCGALNSKPSALERARCAECGSDAQHYVRYLAPGGFSVDVRFKIHDDPSNVGAAKVVDPWVSTRDAVWRSLPDPTVGRVRASADGTVFWFNPGDHGHGYALCLHCGRAESESTAQGGPGLAGHKPLRGAPTAIDDETCTGAPEFAPYAVTRHVSLGHEIRTDLCEVQLYDCTSREVALTVALALREAVADRLGIDADEMGFAAPPAPNPHGAANWSAVVFDRASGGAGFSSTIARDPVALLREACTFLDCTRAGRCGEPEAARACPRCVLAPDTQHVADGTDRAGAFALLEVTANRLELPITHRLFGRATCYEPAPLAQALDEQMASSPDASLIVVLRGDPVEWDFETWPMTSVAERWGARNRDVVMEIERDSLERADAVTRRRVALWIQRARARIAALPASDIDLLALVRTPDRIEAWRSLDSLAGSIGADWGGTSEAPVVRGPCGDRPELLDFLDVSSLLAERIRETIFEIGTEFDGPAAGFGSRLRAALMARNVALADVFAEPCTEIRYSDRYLFSPLVIRLIVETFRGIADASTRINVETYANRKSGRPRIGKRLKDDWPDEADRDVVFEHLLATIGPSARLIRGQNVPHRRRLDFATKRGSGTIFFDQGVGSWSAASSDAFDPLATSADQLVEIEKPFSIANGPDGTFFAIRLD